MPICRSISYPAGDIPFITPFTFGEQGRLPHGELAHGNLMVSSVIFLDS